MKKPKMKEWHVAIWAIGGTLFYFGACKLILTIFPQLNESGVLGIGVIVLFILFALASWAIYTNFGKEYPEKDGE